MDHEETVISVEVFVLCRKTGVCILCSMKEKTN